MNIEVNRNNDTPLYLQIKNGIRLKIISGELPRGFKLPAERQLSEELSVSRNTVVRAYQELISEGFLVVSAKPKGYFVREVSRPVREKSFEPLSKMIRYNYTDKETLFDDIYDNSGSRGTIPMAGINVRVLDGQQDSFGYDDFYRWEGGETRRLKKNICRLLSRRDIFVSEKNIQLVAETTQGVEYIAGLYLKEGDAVILEEPVASDTVNVFRNRGILPVYVSMEQDGMNIEELQKLIDTYRPKFIYTMPNLHNPTGRVMSMEKRMELLRIAGEKGIPIIEENSLRDFRYDGEELPSLYCLDKAQTVLYIDTFTLTTFPGIKTAFIVGPSEAVEMIGRMIITAQMSLYEIGHGILNRFIESGGLERRIDFLIKYYRKKRDYLCAALAPLRSKGLEFDIPEGGLCVWCKLPEDVNEKKLFAIARQKGLIYMPGSVFYPQGYSGSGHIRLCFSSASEGQIDRGVRILSESMDLSRSSFERWIAEAKLQFHR